MKSGHIRNLLTARQAGFGALSLLSLLFVFHVFVVLGVVPADIVWGGQFGDSPTDAITFELVAILVTLLFGVVILMKLNLIFRGKAGRMTNIACWVMFVYFVLNAIGNLSTGISVESLAFAPVSIVLALLLLRLAIDRESDRVPDK